MLPSKLSSLFRGCSEGIVQSEPRLACPGLSCHAQHCPALVDVLVDVLAGNSSSSVGTLESWRPLESWNVGASERSEDFGFTTVVVNVWTPWIRHRVGPSRIIGKDAVPVRYLPWPALANHWLLAVGWILREHRLCVCLSVCLSRLRVVVGG